MNDPSRDCARCGQSISLTDGLEWPDGETLCWSCLDSEVRFLRAEMQSRIQALDTKMDTYLGDSVYAGFDGFNIVLTTNNGEGATNVIFLEPSVLSALDLYRKRHESNG